MKYLLFLFCGFCFHTAYSQLENGTIAPDFTITDISGNTHHLYDYLNAGQPVVLEFTYSWAPPCWSYHTNGTLQELYASYGVQVIMIEGDPSTTVQDILGAGANTQGNWSNGINYPICNTESLEDLYSVSYCPLIYAICPNKIIREISQTESALDIITSFNEGNCSSLYNYDLAILDYVGTSFVCNTSIDQVGIEVGNLGINPINGFTAILTIGSQTYNQDWNGLLNPGQIAFIYFGSVENTGQDLNFSITSNADENIANDVFIQSVDPTGIGINTGNLTLNITTDSWPSEVYWEIRNSSNIVVAFGGDYAPGQNNDLPPQVINENIQLNETGCYTFHLFDTFGDGMTWTEPYGNMNLMGINCGAPAMLLASYDGYEQGVYDELVFSFQVVSLNTEVIDNSCSDPEACNFNPDSNCPNNNTCIYIGNSCDDLNDQTFNDIITSSCNCEGTAFVYGCTDANACNYNALATIDDATCYYVGEICNDGNNQTYNDYIQQDCQCEGIILPTGCAAIDFINFQNTSISPDPILGESLDPGTINIPFDEHIYINPTVFQGYTLNAVDVLNLTINVNGSELPLESIGLSYTCSNGGPSCNFTNQTPGCINLTGIPTETGIFPLTITTNVALSVLGVPFTSSYSLTGLSITILGSPIIVGCTDATACNYNPQANTSGGTCFHIGAPCNDGSALTSDDIVDEYCECVGQYTQNSNACNEVFISEYIEGTANNKAIELYNPTAVPIDLGLENYSIGRFPDGSTTPMSLVLSGIIEPQATYVIVLDKRNPLGTGEEMPISPELEAAADLFVNPIFIPGATPFYFDGNDAVFLAKNDVIIDVVGKIGEDPGLGWSDPFDPYQTNLTTNYTLKRDFYVGSGNLNQDGFNPTLEWSILPSDDFTGLGVHNSICAEINYVFYGSVSSINTSLCINSNQSIELSVENGPVNIGNYSLQWYYRTGEHDCPSGNTTLNWIPVPGAVQDSYNTPEIFGTRTYACFATPSEEMNLPGSWMNGCSVISYEGLNQQAIIGNPNIIPFNTYTYAINTNAGSQYNWSVLNGAIINGQGTSVVSILWGQNGPYQVSVAETNGNCSITSNLNVVNNTCNISVNIGTSNNANGICQNQNLTIISSTTTSNITYQWYNNSVLIENATDPNLIIYAPGSYQVLINQNGCTGISNILNIVSFPSPTEPSISVEFNDSGCGLSSATLFAEGVIGSISWSNNEIDNPIVVNQSGEYFATLTDENGCTANSGVIPINFALTEPNDICLVTVDETTGNNTIVWEPITSEFITDYLIYKETNVANEYALIGSVPYGSDGVFADVNSNAAVQASRYKVGVMDICNVESTLSPLHKTIHLTSNLGVGDAINLIWSHYEGAEFGSYNIYRGTAADNLTLLTTIASNLNSYTDLLPIADGYYMIEVEGISCDPSREVLTSKSNIITIAEVGVSDLKTSQLALYPNPANDYIMLTASEQFIGEMYVIYDITGREVFRGKINSTNTRIALANQSSGSYVLRVGEKGLRFEK